MILFYIVNQLLNSIEHVVVFVALSIFVYSILDEGTRNDLIQLLLGQGKKSAKDQASYPTIPSSVNPHSKSQIHGIEITHPFSCLEKLDDPSVGDWMEEEQTATLNFLNKPNVSSIKEQIIKEYVSSQSIELPDNPVCFGGSYFFFKKLRQELPQYTLFSTPHLHIEAKPVLDPNTLREPKLDSKIATSSNVGDSLEEMLTVHGVWISSDGYILAYGYTSEPNSNNMSIGIRDLKTIEDSARDIIRDCFVDYTNVSWVNSRIGFFYTTQKKIIEIDEDENGQIETYSNRVYFHKLGNTQSSDILIFETTSLTDSLMINTTITCDGHYLLLEIFQRRRENSANSLHRSLVHDNCMSSGVGNKVFYYDLCKFDGMYAESLGSCVKLIDTFKFRFEYISSIEDDFWFRTNYQADNCRVVRITLPTINSHEEEVDIESVHFQLLNCWKNCLDWIPQRTDGDYLVSAGIAAHTILVLKYLKDSSHEVLLYDLTQNLVEESQIAVASLPHPNYGTIIGPNCNFYSSEIFYQFTSYSDPSSVYRALIDRDPFSGSISISFHEVNSTSIPNTDKYLYDSEQMYVETMRNVSVPLLVFGLRGVVEEMNEGVAKPCILIINGGFGVTATPSFSTPLLLFAKHCRGIICVANVQGSGLYGSNWMQNGSKAQKENCVTDLHSIIKYLLEKRFTTTSQLCLYGGGYNGTILGVAVTKFPSLFSTVVIEHGVFDLVRYAQLNPPYTRDKIDGGEYVDSNWYKEFGRVEESAEECRRILNLSPLHNAAANYDQTSTQPAVFLQAALPPSGTLFANSVHPAHSLKFIAQLQHLQSNVGNKIPPLLVYLTQDSGIKAIEEHGKVVERTFLGSNLEEVSNIFSFIIANINVEWK